MANIPISSLPVAVAIDGSEYVPLDQGGTSKRATVSLINASNPANVPPGGVTGQALVKMGTSNYQTGWATAPGLGTVQEVDTGTGLTGGPITLSGTISLASIAAGRVLANVTGGNAAPIPNTPSAVLDVIGSTRGQILYRGNAGWTALNPGSLGQILTTGGPGADPAWSAVGSGSVQSVGLTMPAIFSVSGSPVTTNGTLAVTLANESANLVWAGPSTGSPATPTFRALVGADLPNPAVATLGGVKSKAAVASNFLTQIGTDGSVTAAQPAFSDISGTIANAQFGTQTANTVHAGPTSGGAANPTFRALVGADLPNPSASTLGGVQSFAAQASKWINQISTSGVPSAAQPNFSDLAGSASLGQLPTIGNNTMLANTSGGSAAPVSTSQSAMLDTIGGVQGQVLYRGASNWSVLSPGVNGQVFTTGGAAANPSWTTVTGTGTVTNVATGTGLTGGPITTTGTLSLASISTGNVLANVSGGSAAPTPTTPSAILDVIGSTQGQVLYRGASNWTALGAGASGQFLQTLGVGSTPQWATAVVSIKKQVFTTSGTYTPSSGMLYCIVDCVGGGGGGGAVNGTTSQLYQGGGGASGGYSRAVLTASAIGASQTVTIGSAGNGGSAGANNGSTGGDTSVGTLCVAKGGGGGKFGSTSQVGSGGTPGVAGTGDIAAIGTPGGSGFYNSINANITSSSGNGGSSFYGGGAVGVSGAGGIAGNNAGAYGGGGSGASSNGSATLTAAGGNGSAGVVCITEFCSQ